MKLIRQINATFFILLGSLWTIYGAIHARIGFLISQKAGFAGHRFWARGLCKLMGIHVTVRGLENWREDTAYVVASNHSSIWDIAVLASLPREFVWISKAEVAKVPFMGGTMKAMGCHFVKRSNSARDVHVMKKVEDGLRQGKSVAVFPEGTRSRTGELLPFKKGAFRLAQNSGQPLLPIGIAGTFAIAPPGSLFTGRGHRVTLVVGKALAVPNDTELHLAMETFKKNLEELIQQARTTS